MEVMVLGLLIFSLAATGLSVYRRPQDGARLLRVEAKLDLLLKHAGVAYDPSGSMPPGVEDALRLGNKIEAIKRCREATHMGLAEAKAYVEELQAYLKT